MGFSKQLKKIAKKDLLNSWKSCYFAPLLRNRCQDNVEREAWYVAQLH